MSTFKFFGVSLVFTILSAATMIVVIAFLAEHSGHNSFLLLTTNWKPIAGLSMVLGFFGGWIATRTEENGTH